MKKKSSKKIRRNKNSNELSIIFFSLDNWTKIEMLKLACVPVIWVFESMTPQLYQHSDCLMCVGVSVQQPDAVESTHVGVRECMRVKT